MSNLSLSWDQCKFISPKGLSQVFKFGRPSPDRMRGKGSTLGLLHF